LYFDEDLDNQKFEIILTLNQTNRTTLNFPPITATYLSKKEKNSDIEDKEKNKT
jgi:hypothetical protein